MVEREDVVDIVEELIDTCRDGEKGYRDAAEHVKSSELKTFFNEQSRERAQFASELQSILPQLGKAEVKKQEGSAAAAVHRAWIDLKAKVVGGDKAVLDSVEQGEDQAKEAYQEAETEELPENVRLIVSRQAQSIRAVHDRVKSLRDREAA